MPVLSIIIITNLMHTVDRPPSTSDIFSNIRVYILPNNTSYDTCMPFIETYTYLYLRIFYIYISNPIACTRMHVSTVHCHAHLDFHVIDLYK